MEEVDAKEAAVLIVETSDSSPEEHAALIPGLRVLKQDTGH